MKILDENTPGTAPKPSMFLHGLTGNGKSWWTTTGGIPLVVLLEAKAQSVLRLINPKAIGLVPESLDDLDNLLVYLGNPQKLAAKGIDRIVLDSFTELTLALPRWIKEKMGPVGTLVKLEQSEFGSLQDYALAVVKAIQYTGYPSVIIGRSVSKRVGLAESIRPDSLGKSVEQLPGKLLPTAEARFDGELGYVIDTTPADHSQRCGLPWVPPVWSGSCLDYLRLIEAGPTTSAPTTETSTTTERTATGTPAERPRAAQTPAAQASAINPPAMDCRWSNAIVEFNQATFKAGWSQEERTAAHQKWEALGLAGLDDLLKAIPQVKPKEKAGRGPSAAELPALPPPGAADPAWVALTKDLAAADLAAWGRAYVANPANAKADLAEFLDATARLKATPGAPDPELDPEGYRKLFGDMVTVLRAEKRAKTEAIPAAAAQFADEVAVGPGRASPDDIRELTDLCIELKVDMNCLWSYAMEKGGAHAAPDGSKNWLSLSADFLSRVAPQFRDKEKRVPVISWLHKKYGKVPF
jgi:hypothetical protein